MKELMNTIKKIINETGKQYEIYYIKDYPTSLSINLYYEDQDKGQQVEKLLNNKLSDYITESEVYEPHPDTVKFGFTGHPFIGITLEIDENKISKLSYDHYVGDDYPEVY